MKKDVSVFVFHRDDVIIVKFYITSSAFSIDSPRNTTLIGHQQLIANKVSWKAGLMKVSPRLG